MQLHNIWLSLERRKTLKIFLKDNQQTTVAGQNQLRTKNGYFAKEEIMVREVSARQ